MVSRGLPRCMVCGQETIFTERLAVRVGGQTGEMLWVHERCATQLASDLLLQTLHGEEAKRPERSDRAAARAMERAGLTAREHIALRCMANGYTNQQIAVELGVKHKTARNVVSAVLAKLDAINRAEAVAIATREGMLD